MRQEQTPLTLLTLCEAQSVEAGGVLRGVDLSTRFCRRDPSVARRRLCGFGSVERSLRKSDFCVRSGSSRR
jgi:hypothetical protein